MLSKTKRLEIANVMYANVAGEFAIFCNESNRGANFSWEWFKEHCEKKADLWLMLQSGQKPSDEQVDTAKQFAKEISDTLVRHLQR